MILSSLLSVGIWRGPRAGEAARNGVRDLEGSTIREASSANGDFFIWIRRNPLKSLDSTKGIQGNPRNFPWFFLHFLARNSPYSCAFAALGVRPAREKSPELSLRAVSFKGSGCDQK
jgi:hypothetical protein